MIRSNAWLLILISVSLIGMIGEANAQEVEKKNPTRGIAKGKITALVQAYIDAEVVNAVSIGVVRGDQTWTADFGKLSATSDSSPNEKTIYEIGSVSKVFTGILLAHAVESEKLKLDQSIGSLMTELKTANQEVGDSILLRHLSTHTSGLPRLPDNLVPADPTNPYADYDREKLIEFMKRVKPARGPDVSGEYSNLAAGLLGDLLAANADVDYGTLLDRTICQPLGMQNTTVRLNADQQRRLAPPHNVARAPDHAWDFQAIAGAGAIRSSTEDMIRFIRANLKPKDDLLGKSLDFAWKQHAPAKEYPFAMGLGWHIARDGKTRWHNGQTGGYHSMLMVNRELDAGVIVLCNTASGKVDAIGESIIQLLAGMDVVPPTFESDVKVDPKQVKRLEGEYQLFPTFTIKVRADGEKLFVKATAQPEFQVFPTSPTQWFYKIVDAKLTFELPEDGPCEAVTLHQNGRDMRGKRQND